MSHLMIPKFAERTWVTCAYVRPVASIYLTSEKEYQPVEKPSLDAKGISYDTS
jgi:hypothetical protein